MIQLWILMSVSLILAWGYEHVYYKAPKYNSSKQKISVVFIIITILLGGFFGLRTNYNDTFTYIRAYELTKCFPEFWDTFDASLSSDQGFNLCNGILKTLGVSTQSWLMFYSLVTMGLYLHFIRKHNNNLVLNIFLFFCVGSYTFAGAAIKQSLATAICLSGVSLALEKKWVRYCIVVFIGMTFHVYAVVFFVVPFLLFKPWTKKTGVLIIGSVIVAFSLQRLLGAIVDITATMGEGYTVESFSQEGVNVFRVLVCNAPVFLALVFHRQIFKNSSMEDNLFFNMAMVNGCVMFIGMFGTANYFARLANFFVLAQAITLPWILRRLEGKNRKIITAALVVGYLAYFYYSNNVVYGAFRMERITVMEYVQQLIG